MSGGDGVVATFDKAHTLSRLRELRPLPAWMLPILKAIGSPLAWLALFVGAALYFGYGRDAFAAELSTAILFAALAALYGLSRALGRDLAEDRRPLPEQCASDRELQLAVERLTRGGSVIRVAQGNVIADYVRAHYSER